MGITEESEGAAQTPEQVEQRRDLKKHVTARNVIGSVLLALFFVVGVSFIVVSQNPGVMIDCDELKREGVTESAQILTVQIESDMSELERQRATAVQRLSATESAVTELEDRREQSTATTDETVRDQPTGEAQPTGESPDAATGETAETGAGEPESAAQLDDELLTQIGTLQAEAVALGADLERLDLEMENLQAALERATAASSGVDDDPGLYSPPAAALSLQPREPVALVNIGSGRDPRRVQIVLEPVSGVSSDGAGDSTDPTTTARGDTAQPPAKPTFEVDAGQFRRSTGVEIADDNIQVVARRLGSVVLLDVCITPDVDLDAGRYTGDIYLVDPSLNPVRIPVEVTAQSRLINFLYLLLVLSPVVAFGYIWTTGRISAGVSPWSSKEFWKWTGQNLIICFAVGFAAVWATLQVPFNNPTWGSSVLSAAAVVGVGLVAAVTAMTAVAGRIVESKPDESGEPEPPAVRS